LKRWIATGIFVLYLALLLAPVGRRFGPAPPRAAPERPAPVVPLLESRTGRRLEIPIEDYVLGVVAAEMGAGFPHQALAAQAMAARTYTLHRVAEGVVPTDDIRSFQAYRPERVTDQIRAAVGPTRGAVIVYAGAPIDAVYHACAGGRTAGAAEGLLGAEQPYLQPVVDPPCPRDETWTERFSAAEVGSAAGLPGPARAVTIAQWGATGRAITMLVDGRAVNAVALRAYLGGMRMRSTYLSDVRVAQGQVVMTGRGFGHGVGLSQLGASALAANGFTAEQIVQHYYHGVQIEHRW
jgi:stage II sporulation protein D